MHKLRVWMLLHCTDRSVRIYRDVMVPAVPRSLPKEEHCDFLLTGLFDSPLYVRKPEKTIYIHGQPEERLYDLCYDVAKETWHANVTEHKVSHTWDEATAGPYRDWTRMPIHEEKPVVATAPEVKAKPDPDRVIGYIPTSRGKFQPVVAGLDEEASRGAARVAILVRDAHTMTKQEIFKVIAVPAVEKYLAAQRGQHTDPSVPVAAAISDQLGYIVGPERKFAQILRRFTCDPQRWVADPVLRVGDLAGKTYHDIDAIKGVGKVTIVVLLMTGLITTGTS